MTWSILVRDSSTGALGAAVASKFFAVGAVCIHVEGGVAALATQALVNPMYAFQAMPRLRAGADPAVVVGDCVVPDPGGAQRQFHVLDARGRIAQHTGEGCVTWAGHLWGEDVSVRRQHARRAGGGARHPRRLFGRDGYDGRTPDDGDGGR